jgi:hypothetical protein
VLCPAPNTPEDQTYHVTVCRSSAVTGPYTSKDGARCNTEDGGAGTPVLGGNRDRTVYSPGGMGVFNDVEGQGLVLHYQYLNSSISYDYHKLRWGFNKLAFVDSWLVLQG